MTKFICFFAILFVISSLSAVMLMVPDNPSSIPLLLAAEQIPDLDVTIFASHTQAHSLFLSGKIPLLMTGYAVGESFARRGVPIKLIASWVNSLNYLVSADTSYTHFSQLKGQKVYFPFQGSPIEKLTLWLAEKEGVSANEIEIGYLPFESTLKLMRQGKIKQAVFPVSSALKIVDDQNYFVSFDLNQKWQKYTETSFYPQVCLFADPATDLSTLMPVLKSELKKAVELVNSNPQRALSMVDGKLKDSQQTLEKSLDYLKFDLLIDEKLQHEMEIYFEKRELDKPPAAFYQAN